MNVAIWKTPLTIRAFGVIYRPDLDGSDDHDIRLGIFGDLRMGDRYAVGLIARSRTGKDEWGSVGRLAAGLIECPYDALRPQYEDIWHSQAPASSFEAMLRSNHSSLLFQRLTVKETTAGSDLASAKGDVNLVRDLCVDRLRAALRAEYRQWIARPDDHQMPSRDQVDATASVAA